MMGIKVRVFSPLPRDVSLEDLVPSTATPAPAFTRAGVLGGVTSGAAILSCGVKVVPDEGV